MVSEITSKTLQSGPVATPARASNVVELKPESTDPVATEAGETSQPEPVDSAQQMEQAAEQLNEIAQSISRNLNFSVDESSGDVVIKVLDGDTNEVIRQIPQDHILAMRENIESLKGILFSAKI